MDFCEWVEDGTCLVSTLVGKVAGYTFNYYSLSATLFSLGS